MPPLLALAIGLLGIGYVMRYDLIRSRGSVTGTLWIPIIWLLICASRPLSFWLSSMHLPVPTAESVEDGSPFDAAVFLLLMALAVRALAARNIAWGEVFARNKLLAMFLLFAVASMLWSDFPFVTFKRVVKAIGHLVMVLVILTEPEPVLAFRTVIKRVGYVLLPLSLVFIKYFREFSVSFNQWSGAQSIRGVAQYKNMLGQLCLITGLVFAAIIVHQLKSRIEDVRGFAIDVGFLLLAVNVLYRADSKTSLVSLLFGLAVFFALGSPHIKQHVGMMTLVGVGGFLFADWAFGIVDAVTIALGRDPTWTNRTLIWSELMAMNQNWMLGTGFNSFWLGERQLAVWETRHINEAHNGYLEIILNLGIVGLVLFTLVILSAYANGRRRLLDPNDGRLSMTLLLVAVLYNVPEAGFRGMGLIAFAFYFVAIDAPAARDAVVSPAGTVNRVGRPASLRRPGLQGGQASG